MEFAVSVSGRIEVLGLLKARFEQAYSKVHTLYRHWSHRRKTSRGQAFVYF